MDAHLPDPGRLKELLQPGRTVWLAPARSETRCTRWTAVLTRSPSGDGLVSIDATLPNRLVARALDQGTLEEFAPYNGVRSEPRVGSHRFDFLLQREEGHLLLEVKSVTLVKERTGLFPDAVTERGARHLRRLSDLSRDGRPCAVLFVMQRNDADRVRAASSIDPAFAEALEEAATAGVEIRGRSCRVRPKGVTLAEPVPVDVGPSPGDEHHTRASSGACSAPAKP